MFPWSDSAIDTINKYTPILKDILPIKDLISNVESRRNMRSMIIIGNVGLDNFQYLFAHYVHNGWYIETMNKVSEEPEMISAYTVDQILMNQLMINILSNCDYLEPLGHRGRVNMTIDLLSHYFVSPNANSIYITLVIKLIQSLIIKRSSRDDWFPFSIYDKLDFNIDIPSKVVDMISDTINSSGLKRGRKTKELSYVKLLFVSITDLLFDFPPEEYSPGTEDQLRSLMRDDVKFSRFPVIDWFKKSYIQLILYAGT